MITSWDAVGADVLEASPLGSAQGWGHWPSTFCPRLNGLGLVGARIYHISSTLLQREDMWQDKTYLMRIELAQRECHQEPKSPWCMRGVNAS